jgi:KUP system potassium uptake protein
MRHHKVEMTGFFKCPRFSGRVAFDAMQTSYFLGRETLVAAVVPKMSQWRQWLFTLMSRNAVPATEFFRIPSDRVVELGVRVAI